MKLNLTTSNSKEKEECLLFLHFHIVGQSQLCKKAPSLNRPPPLFLPFDQNHYRKESGGGKKKKKKNRFRKSKYRFHVSLSAKSTQSLIIVTGSGPFCSYIVT
jgi:hypothetical protein